MRQKKEVCIYYVMHMGKDWGHATLMLMKIVNILFASTTTAVELIFCWIIWPDSLRHIDHIEFKQLYPGESVIPKIVHMPHLME